MKCCGSRGPITIVGAWTPSKTFEWEWEGEAHRLLNQEAGSLYI